MIHISEKHEDIHYHDREDRIFVRGISGEYSLKQELKRLRSLPRVIKSEKLNFIDGPQVFSKHFIEPETGLGQTIHMHLEEYAPGGVSQKHGHVNEACFYIIDGKGYDIHDEVRYDWEEGDIVIVPNNCVHQHFNADPYKPARALVIKSKPMYLFMNMLFQKNVIPRPKVPSEHGVGFKPREDPKPAKEEAVK
ncbi:MAG TPA: cupin domain-containing protein [Thermoplasmataceae archaeon]|nr:cupin domain-containing protein [Thermoplasmataceae archaeon]